MIYFLSTRFLILIFFVFLFFNCKRSQENIPEYNPNACTQFSCPVHKDKMSVNPDKCPDCGMQMINTQLVNSFLTRTAHSIYDSIFVYHTRALKQSNKILNGESKSKEEKLKDINEARINIEKAKFTNENLNYLVIGKHNAVIKSHNKKNEKLYAVATYRLTILGNEINKPNHNEAKIMLYTQAFNNIIYELDNEQRMMKIKSGTFN